jgi:hypothetical protein
MWLRGVAATGADERQRENIRTILFLSSLMNGEGGADAEEEPG